MRLPKRQVNIHHHQEHKVFDSQLHQPDTISHTRRVLSRYIQAPILPQKSPQSGHRPYPHDTADLEQSRNQSGTAIISLVDHHHSLGERGVSNGVKGVVSLTWQNLNLDSTSQSDIRAMASREPLILKSDSPLERSKLTFSTKLELSESHDFEGIIGITNIRNSHNVTLDSLHSPVFHTIECNQPLGSLGNFPIQHPNSDEGVILGIDDIIESRLYKGEQYVPVLGQAECSMNYHMQNRSVYSNYLAQSDFQSTYEEPNSSVEINNFNEQLITPPASTVHADDFLMSVNKEQDFNAYTQDISETVFKTLEDSSSLRPSNILKFHGGVPLVSGLEFPVNSHINNDQTEYYHNDTPSQSGSPLMYKLKQWLPDREECQTSSPIGGVKDIKENLFQLTASDIYTHGTPSTRALSDKSATIVSLNETESTEEHKAGSELQLQPPKSKPHLLAREFDIYWKGPDDDDIYVCTYGNCGKKFTRKYNVRTHIQTHLGDRPFVCKICRKSFVRWHDFNRHIKLHTASRKSKKSFVNSAGSDFDKCMEWSKYEKVFDSR